MRLLFESALTIRTEIKKLINLEVINNFNNPNYQGDTANYCISLFQDCLVKPDKKTKIFLQHLGKGLII